LVLVIAALFLGTKGAYLFLFLLLLTDIFFRQNRKKLVYFSIGLLILLFYYFDKIIMINMLKLMNLSTEIYTKNNGFITALSSKRDLLFVNAVDYIEVKWKMINYIVGGTDFRTLKVEIEIVDIFLFFGLAGLILYGFFIKSYLFTNKEAILNYLLILILLIGTMSGNLISSISNTTFFAITFLYLRNNFSLNK
jgi:hypothetical protein